MDKSKQDSISAEGKGRFIGATRILSGQSLLNKGDRSNVCSPHFTFVQRRDAADPDIQVVCEGRGNGVAFAYTLNLMDNGKGTSVDQTSTGWKFSPGICGVMLFDSSGCGHRRSLSTPDGRSDRGAFRCVNIFSKRSAAAFLHQAPH